MHLGLVAKCLDLQGLRRECMDFCEQWMEKFPESVSLRRIRAETITDGFCTGREQDGTRIVERTSLEFFENIVTDPDSRTVRDLCYLARYVEWMGDLERAYELLEQAEVDQLFAFDEK